MFKVEDARITLGKYDRGYCIVLVDTLAPPKFNIHENSSL